MDVAQRTGARLILYALDDYTPLADPLPTAWSGDQEPGEFSDPLTADDRLTAWPLPSGRARFVLS